MARQFVVFCLVLFVVVGFSCAAETTESPKGSLNNTNVGADLSAPGADNATRNTDGAAAPGAGNDVVEAPVGGPGAPAESPKGDASAVEVSAVAAVAAVAGFFF